MAVALLWIATVHAGCSLSGPGAGEGATDTGDGDGDGDLPDTFSPFARSGTRIEFRGYRVAGFENPWQTWDTQLDIECTPRLTTEGTVRCLPNRVEVAFRSADCSTSPVFWSSTSDCTQPEYATIDGDTCPEAAAQAYTLSPIPTPDAPLYFEGPEGCQQLENNPDMVFSDGDPIPLETFAAGTFVTEVGADDVGVEVWEGEDDSRRVMWISWAGSEAWVQNTTLAGERLLPEATALVGSLLFADSSCVGDNAAAYWSRCSTPTHALQYDTETSSYAVHEVAQSIPGWSLRPGQDPECAESTWPQVFALGAEIDPSVFPPVERTRVAGTAVDVEVLTSAGGLEIDVGKFWLGDSVCFPEIAGETIRCIPTLPFLRDDLRGGDCDGDSPRVYVLEEGQAEGDLVRGENLDSCSPEGPEYEWFRIGEGYEGAVNQLGSEDTCEIVEPSGPVHVLEPALPDEYPELSWERL